MKTRSVLSLSAIILSIMMFFLAVPASAQDAKPDSDQLALDVANAQQANRAALAKYSWRVKTQLTKDGETMATNVTEMRFNSDGKLETTKIAGESNIEEKRGLRGRQQEKKLNDFGEYLEGVLDQAFNYVFMSKGTLVDVFDRAKITHTESSVDVSAGDLFVKGDELSMTLDPADKLTRTLTFKTTKGEDTIIGTVTLNKIENGPNRPTKFEIQIPAQSLVISSETYDWLLQK
jgi:hypothetical protein